ncbi:MAG: hypothetical protein KBA30_07300 [Clostridia bacterium]|nr:hypothetical protein [Clostridia bacterium]
MNAKPSRILVLSVVLALSLIPAAAGCRNASPAVTTGTQPAVSSSIPAATTTRTAAATGSPTPSATAAPATTVPSPTVPPTATTTAAMIPTPVPVPSAGTVYRMVEVRDFVMDNLADPPMPGPQPVTDGYASFLAALADTVLATAYTATVGPDNAVFTFTGPNGPGVTTRDPLVTTTGYTWSVPDTLTAGGTAVLECTGSQNIRATSGAETWTSGELYFSLYGGEASTFEMDYTGSGTGLICIDAAFGNALPALASGETESHGTYPVALPAGPDLTLAIEVMFVPFDGNRTLHRVYFYQP